MSDERIRDSVRAFVAAWNERDEAERARLLERSCAVDIDLVTSGRRVRGRDELDAMIVDFQRRCPRLLAAFSSAIEVQGSLFRYTGVAEGTGPGAGGTALDTGACDEDGRIRVLLTFVGAVITSA